MNPIALVLVIFGVILILSGVFWAVRRSKTAGAAISLIGICVALIPFLISLYLAR